MPNFLSKALQKISESFNGPRTNDSDYEIKKEKVKKIEKGMKTLRNIILNFNSYFEKLVNYNKEINEVLYLLYEDETKIRSFAINLESLHSRNTMIFQKLITDLSEVNNATSNWNNYFSSIMNLSKNREESRKINDHYEKKLEGLYKEMKSKQKKNNYDENSNFGKKILRNEEKYVEAKKDYLTKASLCYDTMESLLNNRFDIINPIIDLETKVFENLHQNYMSFHYANDYFIFNVYGEKLNKSSYDPEKFLKHPFEIDCSHIKEKKRHTSITEINQKISEINIKNLQEISFPNYSSSQKLNDSCLGISQSYKIKNNQSLDYHNIDYLDPFTDYNPKKSEPEKDFNKIENQFSSDIAERDNMKK